MRRIDHERTCHRIALEWLKRSVNRLSISDLCAAIGPALGIAIITTLYGAILCYLVFQPIGTRLTMMTNDEVLYKAVILMGVLSIQSGDNPRIVKDKLITYLPPDQREELAEEELGV